MIDVPNSEFPLNIIEALLEECKSLPFLTGHEPVMRPLRVDDPNHSVGVFPVDWMPAPNSDEIGNREPLLQRYEFRVHNLVKHMDPQEGRAMFVADSKKLRIMLYSSQSLRLALGKLTERHEGRVERFQQIKVRRQTYLNNDLGKNSIFLASTEITVETQVDNAGGM